MNPRIRAQQAGLLLMFFHLPSSWIRKQQAAQLTICTSCIALCGEGGRDGFEAEPRNPS